MTPRLTNHWRSGSTLVELVVALTLFGVVAGAVVRALDRQARFHSGISRILEARTQLAASHASLAAELRGASSAAGDVERLTDSSVTYRAQVGSAVVCVAGPAVIDLTPEVLASGQTLARFASSPQAGDTAWLFDEGALPSASDDRWIPASVSNAARVAGACAGSPFIDPVNDAGRSGWRLTVGALPTTVIAGAVARITRHARFALYRASTGETVFGWTEWNTGSSAWNVIQPISGPFLPFNRMWPSASGVALQAWDSASSALASGAPATGLNRLAISTRAMVRGIVRIDGIARGPRVDSLSSVVGLRNWR